MEAIGSGRKVLVVDDDVLCVTMVRDALEAAGYSVEQALDGAAGLELAREFEPELVLLDIMMPRMDGLEVCRRLKADPVTRGIAVVMLTSQDTTDVVRESFQLGATDFIVKPVDYHRLIRKVRSALEKEGFGKRLLDRATRLERGGSQAAVEEDSVVEAFEWLRSELTSAVARFEQRLQSAGATARHADLVRRLRDRIGLILEEP